ncbi:DUF2529 family protein [Evansella sp. AB-rgal1]|uniref:DUF2529 family protein n=1 Tax=Evansella sp. AB-rgal1 TaxID=3242696 RepID=UPI00359D36AC
MKIFNTQLQGLIDGLGQYEEELEDAARIIAQSIVSDGQLWIYGEKEMKGIVHQAIEGADKLPTVQEAHRETQFSHMDTLLVFFPEKLSKAGEDVLAKAEENSAQIISVSSDSEGRSGSFGAICFSTGVKDGLVPTEDGNRIGFPHLLLGLRIYYLLYFTTMEYLEEHGY